MKPIRPDVKLPEMERDILNTWKLQNTFELQNKWRAGAPEFAFYDGPPFANGLPHYGHLLANSIKDIVPRYWIMRGFKVDRKFGWDCHGVPVEYEIEKRDKLKGSSAIKELGIAEFNDRCRASVLHYTAEWEKTITRLGRWVDWNNQYKTMDRSYMESVWWVFSELYRRGLVYRSHKVVPYSPRLTAVVSNFEANQNYKMTQDPSVFVKFRLVDEACDLLAWTTTPWTLVSNLALAVGEEITYVKIKSRADNQVYLIAESRVDAVFNRQFNKQLKNQKSDEPTYDVIEKIKGAALKGRKYEPLFHYFAGHQNAFVILTDSYVSTSDGTGIVHQAPAYGEDDYRVCRAAQIEFVDPIDEEGQFKKQIPELSGLNFKDADKEIIKLLKATGKLFRQETIDHNYPFCERTDTPLMYRAVPAWYVAVEKIGAELVINNQKINWVPEHLKDGRMGHWLANARDWAISRNRFWGTPLPIWVCSADDAHIEVFGDAAALEKQALKKIDLKDLHKQFIDDIEISCPHCQAVMRRVPEVFDCWFESGSMPYAQLHYPFDNKERLESIFPADFIAEGLDQTRGWFYTLSVLSTALFNKPAFKNVIVNGIICDDTGKKMSKRHRNYTPPDQLLDTYGADATRLYMINSPILRGEDLIFSDKGVIETIRAVILPFWNAHSFLTTYASADGWEPCLELATGKVPSSSHEMDQWIIGRLHVMITRVHQHMEKYHLYAVIPVILEFIDELTNWYIRLNRRRFWGKTSGSQVKTIDHDQKSAYETLYYTLLQFSKVFAPFAPFTSERVYKNLTDQLTHLGVPPSVHLTDMPMADSRVIHHQVDDKMALTRRVTELGRSLRAKHQIKIRQPLASMLVITRNAKDKAAIDGGQAIICDELNLKSIAFSTDESRYVRLAIKPNLKTLGKKLGASLGKVKKALDDLSLNPEAVSEFLRAAEPTGRCSVDGMELGLEDLLIERGPKDDLLIATTDGITVLLDIKLTQDLIVEGYAREFVSRIQNLRKDSGLDVSDKIKLTVQIPAQSSFDTLSRMLSAHQGYILSETLCVGIDIGQITDSVHKMTTDIEGHPIEILLSKA